MSRHGTGNKLLLTILLISLFIIGGSSYGIDYVKKNNIPTKNINYIVLSINIASNVLIFFCVIFAYFKFKN
jgi:hypothetical protein